MTEKSVKEPTALEMMIHELSGSGSRKMQSVAKTVTTRVPLVDLAYIEAFSYQTGSSRQKTVVFTLRAGIEECLSKLDEETLRQVQTQQMKFLGDLLKAAGVSEGELFDSEEK